MSKEVNLIKTKEPCPFCGSKVLVHVHDFSIAMIGGGAIRKSYILKCPKCRTQYAMEGELNEVMDKWNTRYKENK